MYEINRAAVIGAGTMGLGIAGQLANAGLEVLLLDIPAKGDNLECVLSFITNDDLDGLDSLQGYLAGNERLVTKDSSERSPDGPRRYNRHADRDDRHRR